MSERSNYLRRQADNCLWHASQISGPETQAELRALAAESIGRAAEIEGAEIAAETVVVPSAPSLWFPRLRPRHQAPTVDKAASLGGLFHFNLADWLGLQSVLGITLVHPVCWASISI
jgi:hypothetical protein